MKAFKVIREVSKSHKDLHFSHIKALVADIKSRETKVQTEREDGPTEERDGGSDGQRRTRTNGCGRT